MNVLESPYERHRWRLLWMEAMATVEKPVNVARREVARLTRLSPDQIVAIRKRRLKDLGGSKRTAIDTAFVTMVQKTISELQHELAMAAAGRRGIDPSVVADAKTARDALETLITEAERGEP